MNEDVSIRQDAVNIRQAPLRTEGGEALSLVAVRIFQLAGLLVKSGDELAKPQGQSSARWQVLAAIEAEPASVAAIAQMLSLARQSVQRVADLLVSEGLAAYRPNPAHKRSPLLGLTRRGHAILRHLQAAQRPWANALAEDVGEAALTAAIPTLDRLLAALSRRQPSST
jgi:DNA-binding MarR family transcriptional regulator